MSKYHIRAWRNRKKKEVQFLCQQLQPELYIFALALFVFEAAPHTINCACSRNEACAPYVCMRSIWACFKWTDNTKYTILLFIFNYQYRKSVELNSVWNWMAHKQMTKFLCNHTLWLSYANMITALQIRPYEIGTGKKTVFWCLLPFFGEFTRAHFLSWHVSSLNISHRWWK